MRKSIFLLLLILLLAACSPGETASPPPPTPTTASTESGDPQVRVAILTAMRAMMVKSHRTHTSMTLTGSGQTQESTVEYVPPDRYHITIGTDELVVIGELVYLKVGGQWEPTKQLTAAQVVAPDQIAYLEASIRNYQQEADESINGTAMKVYTYTSGSLAGTLWLENQTRLWVSAADGLPYQLDIQGDIQGVDPATGEQTPLPGTTRITIEYDPTIQIEITYR